MRIEELISYASILTSFSEITDNIIMTEENILLSSILTSFSEMSESDIKDFFNAIEVLPY